MEQGAGPIGALYRGCVISRLRYIEGALYRKPRYNEFVGKQPKFSLCRGIVNNLQK